MASGLGPSDVLARTVAALDDTGVPYMLSGSFASTLFGSPRATQDIDIVIEPTLGSLERLLFHFAGDAYYVNRDAAREAYGLEGMFNVIDLATGWKIDFIMRKSRPFSREEFGRRRLVETSGLRLYVASAEDVAVAKLEWAKLGESERQIRDVAGILRVQGETLDLEYIRRWVAGLHLENQWEAACRLVPK